MELSELSSQQEASLFLSGLEEWQEGPQVLTYGVILICRKGKARLNVNLLLGTVNLLPLPGLDGQRIVEALLQIPKK